MPCAKLVLFCKNENCSKICEGCAAEYLESEVSKSAYVCRAVKCVGPCGSSVPVKDWSVLCKSGTLPKFIKTATDQLTLQCGGCHSRGSLFKSNSAGVGSAALPQELVGLQSRVRAFENYEMTASELADLVGDFWKAKQQVLFAKDIEKVRDIDFRIALAESFLRRFEQADPGWHAMQETTRKIDALRREDTALRQGIQVRRAELRELRSDTLSLVRKRNDVRDKLWNDQQRRIELARSQARTKPEPEHIVQLRKQVLYTAWNLGTTAAGAMRVKLEYHLKCAKLERQATEKTEIRKLEMDFQPEDDPAVVAFKAQIEQGNTRLKDLEISVPRQDATAQTRITEVGLETAASQRNLNQLTSAFNIRIAYHKERVQLVQLRAQRQAAKKMMDMMDIHTEVVLPLVASMSDIERKASAQLRLCNMFPFVTTLCCSKKHCFVCKTQGSHEGRTCAQQLCKQGVSHVKKCPSCGMFLVKGDGCNSITCVCGHNFSWTSVKEVQE